MSGPFADLLESADHNLLRPARPRLKSAVATFTSHGQSLLPRAIRKSVVLSTVKPCILLLLIQFLTPLLQAEDNPWLTYKGADGPGKGKRIVFITGDEEYRSEESMPAMARILAERHGFHCTVLFSVNPTSGEIDPAIDNNIPGLEALERADLMIAFMRFRHLPENQMAQVVSYLNSGRPVMGVRTATHAFDYDRFQNDRFAEWAWRGRNREFQGGFGRQVLGETWIDHYGGYRSQGTLGIPVPERRNDPILRGIDRIWGPSHAYAVTSLHGDSRPLVMGQPLLGLRPEDATDTTKAPVPVAWTKTFTGSSGKAARVFTTTYGYGEDFQEEGIRRLFVNACYWCLGIEDRIPPKSDVTHVGTYAPRKSHFGGYRRGITPSDLQQNLSTDNLADVPVNEREEKYYRITPIPTPAGAVMEAGSILSLPDGRLAVGTRRGEIYLATGAEETPPAPRWQLFATGLTEVLGLAWRNGQLYATQQGELTRILDTNADGQADRFETVSDAWSWSGEHEYTFGSDFGPDGAVWTVHGLTDSYTSEGPFRGWAMRHFPDGRSEAVCSGLRSPGGICFNSIGDAFYAESQGPWNGSCSIKHLKPGGFMGHPAGNRWYPLAPNMGPRPEDPASNDANRRHLAAARIPQYVPPAVILPYKKMGQSASALMPDISGGKFGPFTGQFFIADYTLSLVMRADLERVNGVYQGSCHPFRQGFATGLIGGTLTPLGHVFVGGSKRGWPVRGSAENALQRLDWSGETPFEVRSMRVKPDGFELHFTAPVDPSTATDTSNYLLETFTHHYYGAYGSPEIELTEQRVVSGTPSSDGLRIRLVVDHLVLGHIHQLRMAGLRDRTGQRLLHDMAYYTLNQIPKP